MILYTNCNKQENSAISVEIYPTEMDLKHIKAAQFPIFMARSILYEKCIIFNQLEW